MNAKTFEFFFSLLGGMLIECNILHKNGILKTKCMHEFFSHDTHWVT